MDIDIDTDAMEGIGEASERVVQSIAPELDWDGKTITQNGVFKGIDIEIYHKRRDLLDGPSVSKSILKHLAPPSGNPKAFWGRWYWNENAVKDTSRSKALDFGRACHALLLGDEVFRDKFTVRPDKAPDGREWNGNNNTCKQWLAEQALAGLTVLTADQIEIIRRMADDASKYDLVQQGILNGRIERSMFWKDPETGIWLRARPDVIPAADGIFCDLKTTSSMEDDFLERQIGDLGYYIQAAMTRMVCRGLGIPFERFVFLYVLNDEVPDTGHVELADFEIDRGELVIRYCLKTIRRCLDSGVWPGAEPMDRGERQIQLKPWLKEQIDRFLTRDEQRQEAA